VRAFTFHERSKSIRCQHVRPEVTIITSRIRVARKDVQELRCSMPHHDLFWHAKLCKRLALESIRIDLLIAGEMQLHVNQCCRQVFYCRKSLIERCRPGDLVHQLLRYW